MREDSGRNFIQEEDFYAIIKTIEDMIIKLEAIAMESLTSRPVTAGVDPVSTEVVKLQKISCPKFSEILQDFEQFKREFNRPLAIAGRPDVEAGINLRDSIPAKYSHLLQHLDMSDHREMMTILQKKFGTKDMVIINIISQIEKMKNITTDKGFIEFVEQLEKINLDLET